jgi:hypothetical protein
MTAETLNRRLFKEGAAILEGTDCDMLRRGLQWLRASFSF